MSLKKDLALVSFLACLTKGFFFFFFFKKKRFSLIVYMQAIQEIFVAEEWVKDARNKVRVEANLRTKANKALGASE